MPFKSAKQKRWMYANHPAMARRWSAEEKAVSKSLPTGYVSKSTDMEFYSRPRTKREKSRYLSGNLASGALAGGAVGALRGVKGAGIGAGVGAATLGAAATRRNKRPINDLRPVSKALEMPNSLVSKGYGYYQNTPTTRKQQRRERARNTASGALTTGGASAGLTAALNPRGARLRPAVQMAAIGGGIGGALGAGRRPRKYRTTYTPVAKSVGLQMPNDTVAKSYVPGKGFVPASQLGAKKLRKVVKPGQYKSRGLDKGQRKTLAGHQANTGLFRSIADDPTTKTKLTRSGTERMRAQDLTFNSGVQGMAWKSGGRRGRKLYAEDADLGAHGKKVKGYIRAHEEAHVSPKSRTSWRLAAIAARPKKIMREEARADMTAGTNYRRARKDVKRSVPAFQEIYGNSGVAASKKSHRAATRVTETSQYAIAATGDVMRRNTLMQNRHTYRAAMFEPKPVAGYRKVQDRMARGQKRRNVSKGIEASPYAPICKLPIFPNTSFISKMSPDPSELHVPGTKGKPKDKRKLKKITAGM